MQFCHGDLGPLPGGRTGEGTAQKKMRKRGLRGPPFLGES